jgi:hypothetical protein
VLLAIFASFIAPAAEAQQVSLPQAGYQGIIVGGVVGAEYRDERTGISPFSLSAVGVPTFGGGEFSVNISLVGGPSPTVLVEGSQRLGSSSFTPLQAARGQINYSVSVISSPGFAGTVPFVPISVTGVTAASLTRVGSDPFDGFADAVVEVSGPGLSIQRFTAVSVQHHLQFGSPLADSDAFTQFYAARPGDRIDVELRARGNLTGGEFVALADPTFTIDPVATFDFDGESLRFADFFEIQYSEGILPIPEPGTGLLVAFGLGMLGFQRSRPSADHETAHRHEQHRGE